ncbi:MAG: hypothetical protein H0V61_09090 [Chitinophagales bacterium]|nr:hypothetical protein [Chitinophagales bacterium]
MVETPSIMFKLSSTWQWTLPHVLCGITLSEVEGLSGAEEALIHFITSSKPVAGW